MGLACTACGRGLLHLSTEAGRAKIRTRLVIVSATGLAVLCRHCGAEAPIDATPGPRLRQALNAAPGRPATRLVVPGARKPVDSITGPGKGDPTPR